MKGRRYQIVQKLGWGRDATVWLAEDRRWVRCDDLIELWAV